MKKNRPNVHIDIIQQLEDRIEKNEIKITAKFIIPFLILCEEWQKKDIEFILNNINALSGEDSWQLLNEFEKETMYEYLVSRKCEKDKRWSDFMKYMLTKKGESIE